MGLILIENNLVDVWVDMLSHERGKAEFDIIVIFVNGNLTSDSVFESWNWFGVMDLTNDILNDVVLLEQAPPAMGLDIVKDDSRAGICLIAADNTRGQDCLIRIDVA